MGVDDHRVGWRWMEVMGQQNCSNLQIPTCQLIISLQCHYAKLVYAHSKSDVMLHQMLNEHTNIYSTMAHTELGTSVPCQRLNTTSHYTSTHMHRHTASNHRHQLVTLVRLVRVHITLWQRMIAISWYVSTELSLCNWELHFTWIYILLLLPLITTVLNGRNLYRGILMTPVKLTSYRLAGKKLSWK